MDSRIKIIEGDITSLSVDAVINAANESLAGGGGVDGAIHRAAGSELDDACKALGGCKTGEAKFTKGFRMSCRYIIHTVGPYWNGGTKGEPDLLASCYRKSLKLAIELECKSIAFPAISCGVYGYPIHRATEIAFREVNHFLKTDETLELVYMVAFNRGAFDYFQSAANRL